MISLRQTLKFALIGASSLAPVQVGAKSLEEVVAVTFNTNPELKQVYHTYKATLQEANIAKSGWYPSIDANASVGIGDQDTPETRFGSQDESIEPISYGISLTQVLFDGFFTSDNIDRTEYEAQADLYTLYASAENTALEVVQAYIEVLKQEQLVALAEKNLESHKEIFEQIRMRTENGLGSTSDLSQANGRLARANANLISVMNNVADAKTAYIRLVGESPEELVYPVADKLMLPASEGLLVDKAVLSHPTIKSAIADIKAAEAQLGTNQSTYYPRVTLEVGGQHTDDLNNDNLERDTIRADIVVSYNLFRGGADSARERQSAYQIEQAKDIKDSAQRQVEEGAKFSWNAYSFIERQLEFLKLHVEQSFVTQQAYKEQFDLGRRTLLDLLDTENELFEARRNFVNAEAEYLISHYRIFNATGDLLSSLRIRGEEYWQGANNDE